MSWTRICGTAAFHHKVIAAGNEAFGAFVRMVAHSGETLTDGHVPDAVARTITTGRVLARLVSAGFLVEVEGGYTIHDFHDYNPPASEVKARRDAERARKAKGRNSQGRDEHGRITSGAPSGDCPPGQPSAVRSEWPYVPAGQPAAVRADSGWTATGPVPSRSDQITSEVDPRTRLAVTPPGPHTARDQSPEACQADTEADPFAASLPPPAPPTSAAPLSTDADAVLAEIRRHDALRGVDAVALANLVAGQRMTTGKPLAWVVRAVAEAATALAADAAGGTHPTPRDAAHRVRAFAANARRPREVEPEDAPLERDPNAPQPDDVPEMPADALPPLEAAKHLRAMLDEMGARP